MKIGPEPNVWHVYPTDDLRPHVTDRAQGVCPCKPDVIEDGSVIVHNSFDGREKFETGERLPS